MYVEVSDEDQDTISVKWVCSIKKTDSELVPKTRLVARGFEEPENDVRKESPTCTKDSLIYYGYHSPKEVVSQHNLHKNCLLQGQTTESNIFP